MSHQLEKINTEKRTPLVLSDYIKIKHGFAFKGEYFSSSPTTDILVTPGNFAIGGGFKADKFKYYKGDVPEDYVLNENDLVVTMTDLSVDADTLGYSALIPKDDKNRFLHNQRVGLVQKKKEGIDFDYLYYLMRTRPYQKYVVSTATGSTVKHTSPDRISGYEYDFPSLSTQKKIASILSAYDAKIENNNKIIKNFEEIIENIFYEWFVNFKFPGHDKLKMVTSEMGEIPEGWTTGRIEDLTKTMNSGGTPSTKSNEYYDGDIPWFSTKELQDNFLFESEKKISKDGLDNSSAKIFPAQTVVMAIYAAPTVGRLGILTKNSTFNQAAVGLVAKKEIGYEFVYLLLKSLRADLNNMANGAAQQNLNVGIVKNYKIVIPSDRFISLFQNYVGSFFTTSLQIQKENIFLKSQRDQLLAKLI